MASSAERERISELKVLAPSCRRGVWKRGELDGKPVIFLCGTLGAEFDAWQRRLAALSAADALFSQQIGLEAVEQVMDGLEAEAKASLSPGERLKPRWSPGYGERPLDLSRTILSALDAPKRIGVTLTESMLLAPSKSVTAVCEIIGKDTTV